MNISKREKMMLYSLGLIVIAFLYYQFGYTTLVNMVNEKSKQKQDIQQKYESAYATIESMDTQKGKVKILGAKIGDEQSAFYPTISQDHIILEIDELMKKSGLEGGMTFKEVEVKGVDVQKKSDKDKDLPQSSIQGIADEYNNKYSSKETQTTNDNAQKSTSNQNTSSSTNKQNGAPSNETTDKTNQNAGNTVTQIQLNVDFNGKYKDVVKFLELLRNYEKKMPAYAINMSTKNLEEVKGSVNMMIYAVPNVNTKDVDELKKYLNWNSNSIYGKDQPFNVNSAAGTGIKTNQDSSDFMVSARSYTSVLPTVTIGKSNDSLKTTYAYADSNDETGVQMVLTKENGKYYYKYKTKDGSIPKDFNLVGSEFVPNGDNIQINIQSESRINSDDKSGLKLKIVNSTDKLVKVDVSGDDKTNPRVSIDGDSQNITVNKK